MKNTRQIFVDARIAKNKKPLAERARGFNKNYLELISQR